MVANVERYLWNYSRDYFYITSNPNPDEPEEKRERGKVAQKGGARRHPTQVSWRDWPEGFPSLR
jgi:hypothetical protein